MKKRMLSILLALCTVLTVQAAVLADETEPEAVPQETAEAVPTEAPSETEAAPTAAVSSDAGTVPPETEDAGAVLMDDEPEHLYNQVIAWDLTDGVLTLSPYYPDTEARRDGRQMNGNSRADYSSNGGWGSHADEIMEVVVQSGILNVGGYAFQNYPNLVKVTLAASVSEIRQNAFEGCTALKELDASVTGEDVTDAMRENKYFGLKTINQEAFKGCTGLETVTLGSALANVGQNAFQDCAALTSLTLIGPLSSVQATALDGCDALSEVTLMGFTEQDTALNFGGGGTIALRNRAALETVTVSGPTQALPDNFFRFRDDDGNPYTREGNSARTGTELLDTMSPNIKTLDLSGMAAAANMTAPPAPKAKSLMGCTTLETVKLPVGMTEIQERTFSGCTALTDCALPDGLTRVGTGAFYGCTALPEAMFPDTTAAIAENAFRDCTSLASVTFPDRLANIQQSAFQGCTALTDVTLPVGLTELTASVFQDCTGLEKITFGVDFTRVGDSAFRNCTALAALDFPVKIAALGNNAFRNCDALTRVAFPAAEQMSLGTYLFADCANLEAVDFNLIAERASYALQEGTFQNCPKLSEVKFSNGVTAVGKYAFEGCRSLVSIVFPVRFSNIEQYAFLECTALRQFTIQSGANVTIHSGAFANCYGMTAAYIPEGVTTVEENAFEKCLSVTQAVIPATARNISPRTFAHCDALRDVYYSQTMAEWNQITGSADLQEWMEKNGVALHVQWDTRNPVIDPMEGEPLYNGGNSGGNEADKPVNPSDPANYYGDALPTRVSSVSVDKGKGQVTARVLGEAAYFQENLQGAKLMAAAYGPGGMTAAGGVSVNSLGAAAIPLDTSGAVYVYVFLLDSTGRPVAERAAAVVA